MHGIISRYRRERDEARAGLVKARNALVACTSYENRVMDALGAIQDSGIDLSDLTNTNIRLPPPTIDPPRSRSYLATATEQPQSSQPSPPTPQRLDQSHLPPQEADPLSFAEDETWP